jgi:polysaccharide biosynthesis protein PslH
VNRPKALFLTHTVPFPPISGERVRSLNLIKQLVTRGWDVSLFSLGVGPTPSPDERRELEELCAGFVQQPFERRSARRALRLAATLATGRAFYERFFYDPAAAARVTALIASGNFDALISGHLYMYPYIPAADRRRTVLDAQNVEAERVASIAKGAPLSARGLVARLQQRPVRSFEADAARQVARVTAVSCSDVAFFEAAAPGRVELVPNGVDCAAMTPHMEPGPRRVLFLGSLDYSANVDAVEYLVREILPRLRSAGVETVIAGSNPPAALTRLAAASRAPVSVAGFVEDTEPSFASARMLAVPLRMGGGTRIKILEALARGTPVVSTTVGCAGLDLEDGKELLVADDPAAFAAAVDRLLEDDGLCVRLAQAGRAAVERRYDWSSIGDAFERAVEAAVLVGVGN